MRRIAVLVSLVAALSACGGDNEGTRADTAPEEADPVQETAAGEDVRARSVVIQLEGEINGTVTLGPVGDQTRVTIQLGEGENANGGAILRGGCDGEPVQSLEIEGSTFDGTIPVTLDELLENDRVVGVELQNEGQRIACGESDAQSE